MLTVLWKRAIATIPVLLILAATVFVLQQVSPVDPARAVVGDRASAEVVARAREQLGLDKPIAVQYVRYVRRLLHGDLGQSAVTRRPMSSDLAEFLPATIELVLAAFLLAVVLGGLLGIALALRWRGSAILRFFMIAGSALPVFLIALLGLIYFYRNLGLLPATGRSSFGDVPTGPSGLLILDGILAGRFEIVGDALVHLVLPATCLAIGPAVAIGRVLRSSLVNVLRSDYARTARAKGLSEFQVLVRHGLRNAAGPVFSMGGLQIAALFGAEIIIERIFAWPGMGSYIAQAIAIGDFLTIAGVTLALGVIYVFANLVVDLCQAAADPRIKAAS